MQTWQKTLVVIILFYIFALLQSSFFVHFSLLGAVPNLVFAFFALLVFFEKKGTKEVKEAEQSERN